MRLFRHVTFLLACLVVHAAFAGGGRISIEVQSANWGNASVADIRSVLQSIVDVLAPDFPQHAPARIVVAYSATGPRVSGRRSADDPHMVFLNVQDRRWDQFAYQFSHELCHILSNHDRRPMGAAALREHQWFEETLCEVVSLVTLNRLASSWKQSPPKPGWDEYAFAFSEYAATLLSQEHRRAPANQSLGAWYVRHQAVLDTNPYARRANEQLAASLLELFESAPRSLEAIGYLNIDVPSQQSFAAYLAAWRDCCPPEHRPFVNRLIALFTST